MALLLFGSKFMFFSEDLLRASIKTAMKKVMSIIDIADSVIVENFIDRSIICGEDAKKSDCMPFDTISVEAMLILRDNRAALYGSNANHPTSTLRGKFDAAEAISMYFLSLSLKGFMLYASALARSKMSTTAISGCSMKPIYRAPMRNAKASMEAALTEILPAARGLLDFVGCFLSLSKSVMSFMV